MSMPVEKTQTMFRASQVYSEAVGISTAGAKDTLMAKPDLLINVAEGLRIVAGGASPLADEIDEMAKFLTPKE